MVILILDRCIDRLTSLRVEISVVRTTGKSKCLVDKLLSSLVFVRIRPILATSNVKEVVDHGVLNQRYKSQAEDVLAERKGLADSAVPKSVLSRLFHIRLLLLKQKPSHLES